VKNKLAILSTHPIQYQAHWFRALTGHPQIELEVMFCHKATPSEQATAGFGVEFEWDLDLLNGYPHRFLSNIAVRPNTGTFGGLDTPDVAKLVERNNYDAVIINGWHYKSAWQAIRACWRTKTPVMVRSDSHLHTKRGFFKRLTKAPFYRWFISKLDACLPVGTWSRDYFLHYGASPDRVFTVPHVVDLEYFADETTKLLPRRQQLRARWSSTGDDAVFLFAGKFIQKKRPMDFVLAIGEAIKKCAPVTGLMVGDGPLRAECEHYALNHKLPICFSGFLNQSEIAQAYIAADALVLPSDETWGLVANESMACGRPCFVSDQVGCGPDLITPQNTGEVFRVGDVAALGQLMTTYSKQPQRLSQMGRNALTKAFATPASLSVGQVLAAIAAARTRPREVFYN
jgi:glycosyltransferase involved in cell wall biosynthesis